MNWFSRLLAGRYGHDKLSTALLALSLLLILIAEISHSAIVLYLSYIPLGLAFYRMFSKQLQKRRLENYKFMMLLSPLYAFCNKRYGYMRSLKTHRYFKCPDCKRKLRVPKGKGKIIVSCPKCHAEFPMKT